MARFIAAFITAAALAVTSSASAGSVISNDMSRCTGNNGPAVKVVVSGIKNSSGRMRVQSYPSRHGLQRAAGSTVSKPVHGQEI